MRILFLTHRVPYPPDKGDRIRSYNIIKGLARHHSISLMSLSHEPWAPQSCEALKQYCDSVEIVGINAKLSRVWSGLHLFTTSPLTLPAFYSRRFHRAVRDKLQTTAFDLIYIYSSSMAQYVIDGESEFGFLTAEAQRTQREEFFTTKPSELSELCVSVVNPNPEFLTAEARGRLHHEGPEGVGGVSAGPVPKVMDFIDVDSQKWFDYAATARQPMKAIYRREGIRLRAFEKQVAARCALNLFTTESELKIFQTFAPNARAMALPNGVDLTPTPSRSYRPNRLLFVGSMDYRPNIDAMLYFTDEILPLIEKEIPGVELFIVGRNPSSQIKALDRRKNVTVTGEVADVGSYLQDAAASVIPLRIARGIQTKLLEAMAHGVPVIATHAALDGIAAKPARDLLVADEPHDFAGKTVAVLQDRSMRAQLAANALALVQKDYRWETTLEKLEDAIASLAPNSSASDANVWAESDGLNGLNVLNGLNQARSTDQLLQAVQKDLRCEAHEKSTSAGVQSEYVGARRSSGTTQVSPFQQPDKPFVSFVIPAKNEAQMIGQCLDAINNLTYDTARYECIVVDNGSVDDTAKIAKQKGAKVLTLAQGTIAALRNFGAKQAQGEYLAFIDADCAIDAQWLNQALPHFEDPSVGCAGSHPDIPAQSTWVQKTWHLQNASPASAESVSWLPSMNMLVKKTAFEDCGGFNESLVTCEDVDFCYRLKRSCRIVADGSIKSVHFGEAKTIAEFFSKERWRGQSNLPGLMSHGFHWQEVPSLLLPIYYLIAIICLPVSLINFVAGSYLPFLVNTVALLLPSLLLALRMSLRAGEFGRFGQLTFLYLVYSLARAAAMSPVKRQERSKDLVLGKVPR